MFFASFAWSFVFVSLPFHIQAISTLDPVATLTWTGWILGITSLITVVSAPLWGRLAERRDPRLLYVAVETLQGLGFFAMAAARTLGELFMARMVLGVMGASSTFAFMLAGRAPDAAQVRRQVAAVQSAMTVGQVLGPLAGAVAAARLGFRPSFVLGGLILLACALVVRWGAVAPEPPAGRARHRRRVRLRDLVFSCAIVLVGSTQLFFLASVLPQILPELGVAPGDTLQVGGILIFASAAAAAVGAVVAPWLADAAPERRLVPVLLGLSAVFMGGLALAHTVWPYTVVRFLQVLCIAPVFPLVVARVAQSGGAAIGLLNSARIAAAFVGPVLATTILARAPAESLYLVLALLGLGCVPMEALRERRRRHRPASHLSPPGLPPDPTAPGDRGV
jgi:DHA1 family multidrug resistance protein-like MFS transporter